MSRGDGVGRGQENLFDLPLRPADAGEPVERAVSGESQVEEEFETRVTEAPAPAAVLSPPNTPGESYSAARLSDSGVRPGTRIAPLLPRYLAAGADFLVHLGALAAAALGLNLMGHEPVVEDVAPLLVLLFAFSFLYTVISLAFWGQTAGMAWFGLASRQSPQFPLSFGQAAVRWLAGLISFALLGLPLLLALRGGSLSDRLSRSQTYRGFAASQ